MNTYIITLKHDSGKTKLITNADNEAQAVKLVCDAEGCPPHAIIKIECNPIEKLKIK